LDVIVNFKLHRKGKMKVAENPTKEKKKTKERKKRKRSASHYGRELEDGRVDVVSGKEYVMARMGRCKVSIGKRNVEKKSYN